MDMSGTLKNFRKGDLIMRQGDSGGSAYIIEEGRVEILIKPPSGSEQSVGTRGPGSIIGEMALVDNAPRTATVKAMENCKLIEISREDFSRRLKTSDPVMNMVMGVILTRYRDTLTRSQIMGAPQTFPPPESIEQAFSENDAVASIKIENEFKAALKNGDLCLNYQPIVDLETGYIKGFEALMRWNHPERGVISPAIFIPMAEKSGLIIEASKWALREACNALKRIEGRVGHIDNLTMSVNFSSKDFAEEDFLETLYNIISISDVKPAQIQLEITETVLMQQPDNAKETLTMCQKSGLKIAIDDFGTGYSSLSYLHYFPINVLKIDQAFIRDFITQAPALELVKSIIGLGKNLGMKIIAEGVETKEEAIKIKELGCDCVQGYFFAKPMPEKEVGDLIVNWIPVDLSS